MTNRLLGLILLIISQTANAAIGGSDQIDLAPLPNEFCNADAREKQQTLLNKFPRDEGIIKHYAFFIGLCQLAADGHLTEREAGLFWARQRDELLRERQAEQP
ncbi:hypothetical protein [Methylomonas koyamae]|nr:hypothetical protein [Methylomonas koyamae]